MATPIHYCSVEGCEKRVQGNGLCSQHYMRMRRHGTLELLPRISRRTFCTICGEPSVGRGLCDAHYRTNYKNASPDRPRCIVDGCTRPLSAKGYCELHYERIVRTGTADDPTRPVEERFWEKVDRRGPNDCWEWQAAKNRGYGAFGGAIKDEKGWHSAPAHRFAYELLVGPIPAGAHLHHTCENPGCVNPAHLEIKTPSAHFLLTWIQTLRSLGYVVIEPI